MAAPVKKLLACCAVGVSLLVIANVVVAVRQVGTRAGQTYRWVCPESGARLSWNPSVFGSARLSAGGVAEGRGRRWVLVEPQPPSPLLPWNWLVMLLDRPAPDPEAVIRQERLGAN
jgi:hypothetical protein